MGVPYEINPFEPPKTSAMSAPRADGHGAWNDGGRLATSREALLPDRCVKCNRPAQGYQLKKTLYWHSPFLYLLLFSVWIYVIVALIVRKKAFVTYGLCPEHRASRRAGLWWTWGLVLASLVLAPAVAIALDQGLFMLFTPVGLIAAVIVARVKVTSLLPTRISDDHAFLKGAGAEFVASLPRFGA